MTPSRRSYVLFALAISTVGVSVASASPAPHAAADAAADLAQQLETGTSAAAAPVRSTPASATVWSEPAVIELPDDGPRREPWVTEEALQTLQAAQDAFAAEQWDAAWWMFTRAEEQAADSGLAPMARAYRAELTYQRQATPQYRLDAIDIYQSLIRDFPQSANASRAGWRVGDLYREQAWTAESQASYERGAKSAVQPEDRTRAFLGLGLLYVHAKKWTEAAQTLKALRSEPLDNVSRGWMTLGIAQAMYGLGRRADANEYFQQLEEKWPERLRQNATALLHAGDLAQGTGRHEEARTLRMLFYNLYPTHPQAPSLVIAVGDSFRKYGDLKQAERMYGLVIERHPATTEAQMARLRLATLGPELAPKEPAPERIDPSLQMATSPRAPLSPDGQREIYQDVSTGQKHNALGSEALVLLAEHYVTQKDMPAAQAALQQACDREGLIVGDEWPARARVQLAKLLRPKLAAAVQMADDLHTVELYHRYGRCPDWRGAHTDLLFQVAESHRRLGFLEAAIQLYQVVLRDFQATGVRDRALLGLGRTYLDQRDGIAARRMFERYQLEFPLGALKSEALRYLSESWALLGDASAVIRTCQRWFKAVGQQAAQDPGYGQILLRLASAQAATGRHMEAIAAMRKAERVGVLPYVEARMREGRYLEASGALRAAITQWAEVVRSEPASEEASLARLDMARLWWKQQRMTEVNAVLGRASTDGTSDVVSRATTVLKAAAVVQANILKEKKP